VSAFGEKPASPCKDVASLPLESTVLSNLQNDVTDYSRKPDFFEV